MEHAIPTQEGIDWKQVYDKVKETSRQHFPKTPEEQVQERVEEISGWWRAYSEEAIERTAPKSVEYAGSDLDIMAAGMVALLGDRVDGMPDVEKMRIGRYMAVQFYALGKVSRSLGRLAHGEMPGEDNEFDLMVYAVMARRIRETGVWT